MANPTPGSRPGWVSDELFPFQSRFLELRGHVLHYVDEGNGPVLLMYHGNPSWSFLYRDIIAALRDEFRCVAFDYPGMGLSTAAAGFTWRAGELADVAEAFVARLDLHGITPMVQDSGRSSRASGRRQAARALPGGHHRQHLGVARGHLAREAGAPQFRGALGRPSRAVRDRSRQPVRQNCADRRSQAPTAPARGDGPVPGSVPPPR